MQQQRPPLLIKDLGAKIFVGRTTSASTPPASDPTPASVSSGAARASASTPVVSSRAGVWQRPAEAAREGAPSGKMPGTEGQSKAARQRLVEAMREREPEGRPKAESSMEQSLSSSTAPQSKWLAPWRPSLQLRPGRPLKVEDRLLGNPLVVAALSNACALPLDIQRHKKVDDMSLLGSSLQSALSIVQKVHVVLTGLIKLVLKSQG